VAELFHWLVYGDHLSSTVPDILHGVAHRLNRAGFELIRSNAHVAPLSPQIDSRLHIWRLAARKAELSPSARVVDQSMTEFDGAVVQSIGLGNKALHSAAFAVSPFHPLMLGDSREVRCRLTPDQTEFPYPIVKDVHAQGATEYFALAVLCYGARRGAISFVTKRAGGFSDEQIATLRRLLAPFALVVAPIIADYTLRSLLSAYLGPNTAGRVLEGKVNRGDVDEIETAIWFSDLRGFTPLSAGIDSHTLIAWLNEYFAAVARAIVKHDGEILKFIGDAVLAVWPVTNERTREAACRASLAAAREANVELGTLNADRAGRGLPPLQHGIGLHVGRVQYGNRGAEGRLDFTVIGSAVNTAARLEGVCAKLSRRVIASAEHAACVSDGLVPLGQVPLKGIDGEQAVFGLSEDE
jgi:adenylate cyclase